MTEPERPPAEFEPSGFFVLRTPVLPFDAYLQWTDGLESSGLVGDSAGLERALAADRERLRHRLAAVVARPEIREALFVASPSLEETIDLWLAQPLSERGQRAERAIYRYFARMAGRATPFGLFAGCAVGRLGPTTDLRAGGTASIRRHTRLDMDYLWALTRALERDPAVRKTLTLHPNSSLYATGERLHYIEGRDEKAGRRYRLVAVEQTEALAATLERAAGGATFDNLSKALVDDEIAQAEAEEFIARLIEDQVLVGDLEAPVTGADPLRTLVDRLRVYPTTQPHAECLARVSAELTAIDAAGLGVAPERYRAIASSLASLPAKPDIARLFQVDLETSPGSTLSDPVIVELNRAVRLLHRICRSPRPEALDRFRDRFTRRYEGREVPLLAALDEEAGIGFDDGRQPTPLIDELLLRGEPPSTVEWTGREAALLELLTDALSHGAQQVELDAKTIDKLATTEQRPLPAALAVMARLAAESSAALASGRFSLAIEGVEGPSGARLLGRFCNGDPDLTQLVMGHLRAEEAASPKDIFAEIVHLPEGRIGNILLRPVLRQYEIPFLGSSGAKPERQLPVTDLMVSVVGDEIRLRSHRLGLQVVPRLTTAHNYFAGLGLYRFLCALQTQGTNGGMNWDWGPLASAPFLPRVSAGRLVLSRARWRVGREELSRLSEFHGVKGYQDVQRWRTERRLPRWVTVMEFDNALLLDLDNPLAVDVLAHLAKDREAMLLEERFPPPEQLCAQGPDGRFVHQLIVPIVRTNAGESAPTPDAKVEPRIRVIEPGPARSFPPGSEWLYAQLYTGEATVDQVLLHAVAPVAKSAIARGAADRWFFIRYGDPDWHLRVRFHGDARKLEKAVWPKLKAAVEPFLADGRIHRVALGTYEREVERYGGPEGIALGERLFQADSESVIELLDWLETEQLSTSDRWQIGLVSLDRLMHDLGFDLAQKEAQAQRGRDGLIQLLGSAPGVYRRLGARFRSERANIEPLIDLDPSSGHPLAPGLEILARRSRQLAPVVAELKDLERAGRLAAPIATIAGSYLHMHVIRLMPAAQQEYELVLYEFLSRLYSARVARQKANS